MGDVRLTAPGFIVDPDVMTRAMKQAQKICLKAQAQKICPISWHGRAR